MARPCLCLCLCFLFIPPIPNLPSCHYSDLRIARCCLSLRFYLPASSSRSLLTLHSRAYGKSHDSEVFSMAAILCPCFLSPSTPPLAVISLISRDKGVIIYHWDLKLLQHTHVNNTTLQYRNEKIEHSRHGRALCRCYMYILYR